MFENGAMELVLYYIDLKNTSDVRLTLSGLRVSFTKKDFDIDNKLPFQKFKVMGNLIILTKLFHSFAQVN